MTSKVSAFTNDWKKSVDLSVDGLSSYAKGLSDDLGAEVNRAKAAEEKLADVDEFLSAAISSTVYVKNGSETFG